MSNTGQWACIATGETPLMCHRIAFIPLKGPALATVAAGGRSQQKQGHYLPSGDVSPHQPSPSGQAADGEGAGQGGGGAGGAAAPDATDHDVFIRRIGPTCCNTGGGGGGASGGQPNFEPAKAKMETVECGGAVLSLSVSRDDRFIMANVRPFAVSEGRMLGFRLLLWHFALTAGSGDIFCRA